jgi:hypothetical protein
MSAWSGWQDILAIKDFAGFGKCAGIYKIRRADPEGVAVPVARLEGNDEEGLLAIGESNNLARRIKEFHDAYIGKRFQHSSAVNLFITWVSRYSPLQTSHGQSRIQVTAMKLGDKIEAEKQEEELFKRYFVRYGELPPLNNKLPDKHNPSWHGIINVGKVVPQG